jgi:hypothetical protein
VVGSNIWITNHKTTPTALIPAQFGVAPLNEALAGTTTDPTQAYNNQGVAFATELRASGAIPAEAPIVIVPDWEPSKSISNWIDSVGTDAYTVVDLWARLQTQLAVVTAAYPGAKIDHVIWSQGENDSGSSSSYNSKTLYLGAFTRLITRFQALPQWTAYSRISVTELGTWANNSGGQARNDALRMLEGLYAFVSLASSQGLTESADNAGPHYDGASLVTLGQRHFRTSTLAALAGLKPAAKTSHGSALAFPNQISAPAGGLALSSDDIRSGALILANGGTITLPNAANVSAYPLRINAIAQSTLAAQGTLSGYNGGTQTTITMRAGTFWEVTQTNLTTWRAKQILPGGFGQGDQSRYTATTVITGTQTYNSTALNGVCYTFNGATVTLTPTFGIDAVMYCVTAATTLTLSSGNFRFSDGSTATTLTLQPNTFVHLFGAIESGNGVVTLVRGP